jgi:predicted kinase
MQRRQGAMVAFLAGLRRKAERGLRDGHDVLVDGCNTRKGDRTGWVRIAREYGATPLLVVFHTPLPDLLRTQVERGKAGVPEHKVRMYHMEYLRALPMLHTEGWARITHIRRDGSAVPITSTHVRSDDAPTCAPQHKRISNW